MSDDTPARPPTAEEYLDRIRTSCPACSYAYDPTSPDEVRAHAELHEDYEFGLRCSQPDPRLEAFGGDVRVDATSPGWLQAIVCYHARGLDMVLADGSPWLRDALPEPGSDERDLHALVLVENRTIPVGAALFSWINWDDAPGWHLGFVRLAYQWERKGVLTRRWPGWRETYGAFTLEQPLTCAMQAFVAKVDPSAVAR